MLTVVVILGVGLVVTLPRTAVANDSNVAPAAGVPGTTFAFYATGFDGNEQVGYWFNAPDGSTYSDDSDYKVYAYQGRADWEWKAPEDAMPGFWTAVARGVDSDVEQVIHFEVHNPAAQPFAPPPPPAPTAMPTAPPVQVPTAAPPAALPASDPDTGVHPTAAVPGEQVAFFAMGFQPGEQVSYWATNPTGMNYGSMRYMVSASAEGRADWHWTVPGDTMAFGNWVMVARGQASQVEKKIYFRVQPGTPPVPDTGEDTPGEPVVEPSEPQPVISAEPTAGDPNDVFDFSVSNFPPRETVRYYAVGPDGTIDESDDYKVHTNVDGYAEWEWKSLDSPQGAWTMVAEGEHSEVRVEISVMVGDPAANPFTLPDDPAANTPTVPGQGLQNPPDVGVEPAIAPPDSTFAFFAAGFPSHETVRYWAVDPNGVQYTDETYKVHATVEGRADWTWDAPDNASYGTWTMVALGEHNEVQKEIQFMVGDPGEPGGMAAPSDRFERAVEPMYGTANTKFAFFVAGLPPHETVRFWAIDPNGHRHENDDEEANKVHANDNGRADWTWKAPDSAVPGQWKMVAWGEHNDIRVEILFEIR
jgi:hypothetical protein